MPLDGLLCALGSAGLYGLNIVYARVAALAGANGPAIVVYRVLLMLAVVATAVALTRRSLAVAREERLTILVFGLSTAVLGLCYVSSVAFIPVTVAAVIFYAYPVLIVLASPIVERTPLRGPLLGVVVLALIGVVMVVGPAFDGLDWRGLALALGAAGACAVQFFAAARCPKTDVVAKVFWSHLIVLPTAIVVSLITGQLAPPSILAAAPFAVFMTIGGYVVGFLLQIMALRRISAVAAGIIYCLEPVVSALTSVSVLRETLSTLQIAGGLLVLAAIATNIVLERSRQAPLVPRINLMSAPSAGPPPPIPLTILTGFLGAGKTTLLNRLLKDPALQDSVVIINEFGEIGLDHLLVEAVDDGMVLLSAGCLCCTVRGDLIATLEDLLRKRDNSRIAPFRRVVIETTGLADPAPILHAVLYHPYLSMRYALEGVVTVIDAINGEATLDAHREAVKQAAVAERIVLTKTDLVQDRAGFDRLRGRLRGLNPGAAILNADAPVESIVAGGLFDLKGKIADVGEWLKAEAVEEAELRSHAHQHGHEDVDGDGHGHDPHHHDVNRHDERIRAFCLTSDAPIREGALDMFLDLLRSAQGARLLRVKGLVGLAEDPEHPVVIHGVQHVVHVPAVLSSWPGEDRRSRMVFIVDGLERSDVEKLWNAVLGRPAIDQPDATALADNPLSLRR